MPVAAVKRGLSSSKVSVRFEAAAIVSVGGAVVELSDRHPVAAINQRLNAQMAISFGETGGHLQLALFEVLYLPVI